MMSLTRGFGRRGYLASEWRDASIAELCEFVGGYAFPRKLQGRTSGNYPFFKVSDMNAPGNERELISAANWVDDDDLKLLRAKTAAPGTVVFPKVGAALKTEKRRLLVGPALFDNNVMGLLPSKAILPQYLLTVMETIKLGQIAQEGVVPSVNQSQVGSIRIPVPTIEVQRRIVDLIDRVDTRLDANRQAVAAAEALLSRTREMILSKATSHLVLGDVLTHIEVGESPRCLDRPPSPSEWGVLKISAVRPARFFPQESKALPPDRAPKLTARIRPGDLLVTRSNTIDRVGAACVVDSEVENLLLSDLIFRLRLDESAFIPAFVAHAFASAGMRRQIEAAAVGTSGSMKKVNQGILRSLRIPAPAIADQEAALGVLEKINAVIAAHVAAGADLERFRRALINSLLQGQHDIPDSYDRFLTDENPDSINLETATV
jgi:type I restriction enzyme S subunit